MTANALVPASTKSIVERRNFFGVVASGITGAVILATGAEEAQATPAKTGPASVFTGDYEDPNHPGCLRQVKVVGAPLKGDGTRSPFPVMEITGYDGSGDPKVCTEDNRPTRSDLWKIQGTVKSDTKVFIDFSPKGGPADLVGKWDGDGIVFPDGNKWTKVPLGTKNRFPKDMKTLKSPN
jgi:hypothetical protein